MSQHICLLYSLLLVRGKCSYADVVLVKVILVCVRSEVSLRLQLGELCQKGLCIATLSQARIILLKRTELDVVPRQNCVSNATMKRAYPSTRFV